VPAPTVSPLDTREDTSEDSEAIDGMFALFGWNERFLDEPADDLPLMEISRPWVLCIDDDSDFSFTLKMRLERQGVDVLRAYAGMEGYRYAFTSEAQAIILDFELPNGNGDYVLGRLKENPVTKDIPVIVLTGRKDKALERRMYALGATSFFTKPYDWTGLWAELQRHLPQTIPAGI
jgi:DNA-binding response OmpR family regulator